MFSSHQRMIETLVKSAVKEEVFIGTTSNCPLEKRKRGEKGEKARRVCMFSSLFGR